MSYAIQKHKLLPQLTRRTLPPLGSTDGQGWGAVAQVKYFSPDSGWYWYATEFDGADVFFGLVFGPYVELGYFSLSELEGIRGPLGLPVERDRFFQAASLEQVIREHREREGDIRHYL